MSLVCTVSFDEDAAKDLRALGAAERRRVLTYLREWIATPEDPRRLGKALTGDLKGLWRYRIGDVRVVGRIEDKTITVLVLHVAQRWAV